MWSQVFNNELEQKHDTRPHISIETRWQGAVVLPKIVTCWKFFFFCLKLFIKK